MGCVIPKLVQVGVAFVVLWLFIVTKLASHLTYNIQVLVKPKCGRLVGFSAGKENMHGVKAVTKGLRCAVALWLTLDPNHSEAAFDEAEQLLTNIV